MEVIFFDTMDRNRNNLFLSRQTILNLYKILNIYLMFKFTSFVLQETFVLAEPLLGIYGIKQEMPNPYAISWQWLFFLISGIVYYSKTTCREVTLQVFWINLFLKENNYDNYDVMFSCYFNLFIFLCIPQKIILRKGWSKECSCT